MKLPQRIQSIDVLRAITMVLMIFVNDVAGVAQIPKWIEHTEADFDGMGFSDLIFPAFLFIVGLSLPFAIQGKLKRGDSYFQVIAYIVLRAFALIVMGFFHVNLENYNQELAAIGYPLFTIILTVGFFLIWLDYPVKLAKTVRFALIGLGIALVAAMAWIFKGGSAENPTGLQPQWWGILGIIGWAYLFAALTYLLTKGKLLYLLPAFVIFALINITTHLGWFHVDLGMIGDASSISLMLGGAVIAGVYKWAVAKGQTKLLWSILAAAGIFAIALGFFVRPYAGGISKIYSTPAWVFICMGITILLFELLIYIVDFKEKKNWFNFIKPAGTSTLTCYLLPYLLYSIFTLINFNFPDVLNSGIGGILRSLFMALLIVRIVAIMEKAKIRLSV
jgi:heparan-alpha-glucosaminide N-acetyltransferase